MTKKIYLSGKYAKGRQALVDDADYEWLNGYRWHCDPKGYAMRSQKTGRTPSGVESFRMHREIMNAPKDMQVDHINGDTLDNRRGNLRLATPEQNARNAGSRRGSRSKYKGVTWDRTMQMWRSKIREGEGDKYLGDYLTQAEAALAYNKAAKILHGEFAKLNIVKENDPDDPPVVRHADAGFGKSQYTGVHQAANGQWIAKIDVNRRRIWLGTYATEEAAARAYDTASKSLRGQWGKVNFPEEWSNHHVTD